MEGTGVSELGLHLLLPRLRRFGEGGEEAGLTQGPWGHSRGLCSWCLHAGKSRWRLPGFVSYLGFVVRFASALKSQEEGDPDAVKHTLSARVRAATGEGPWASSAGEAGAGIQGAARGCFLRGAFITVTRIYCKHLGSSHCGSVG